MGRKQYYCDYCERSFNDDAKARTLHLQSAMHITKRDEHYRLFKDPALLFEEEQAKRPCRVFNNDGYCRFGFSCRFSHYSPEELNNLRLLAEQKEAEPILPNLSEWFEAEKAKKRNTNKELSHKLPVYAVDVPLSLQPFDVEEYLNAEVTYFGT